MSSLIMQHAIPKRTNYKNSSIHYHATLPSLGDFDTIQSCNSEFKKDINTSWLRKNFDGGALKSRRCRSLQCSSETAITRRSANYKPPSWDFNYIQSLTTQYKEERYSTRAAELIEHVKMLLQEAVESVRSLELIDDLQRLGISHHFHDQINQILSYVHCMIDGAEQTDLYSTALTFRLLRQHGFRVSQDVFDCFKNNEGSFIDVEDTRGVLQLYEASFLLTQGEETLELAKEFATNFLHRKLEEDDNEIDENMLASVRYALELPTHWRIQRPNARWFIDAYGKRPQMNPIVLELAKLDFNITQAMHQQELKLISRWWKETKLAEKLPFVRDRLVECYLWNLGIFPPEQYSTNSRMMATKANIFITIMDDIFDVYATLEELQLFSTAMQRWDLEAVYQLPTYMQLCFLQLDNFINEMAYDVLKEQDILIIQHLRKSWRDLFTACLQEARWHATGHTPTLNEYLSIGWISSTVPVILSHAYFLITNPVDDEVVRSLYGYHDVVRFPSLVLRLANDLATSTDEIERGEVANSVECYMKESGGSREEARLHVEFMIWETWKNMNRERAENSEFSEKIVGIADDLSRMVQYMYQYGDGHGVQNPQIKERISTLLFEPIP